MVDPDEGGMGDQVQALLAAILGMDAPADIGKQAGRMAKPLFLLRLVETDRLESLPGPRAQFRRVARRARAEQRQFLAGDDQRVERLFLGRQQVVEVSSRTPSADMTIRDGFIVLITCSSTAAP